MLHVCRFILLVLLPLLMLSACGEETGDDRVQDDHGEAMTFQQAAPEIDFCTIALQDRFLGEMGLSIEGVAAFRDKNLIQVQILYTYKNPERAEIASDTLLCAYSTQTGAKGGVVALRQFGEVLSDEHVEYTNMRVRLLMHKASSE